MKKIALLLCLIIAVFGVSAYGQGTPKKVTIGMAIHGTDNEYWNQEAEGGKLFAASLPPGTAEVQVLTCDGDDAKQLNGIKALIAAKGKDVILYVDPSNAPNTAAIAEVCEKLRCIGSAFGIWQKGLIQRSINIMSPTPPLTALHKAIKLRRRCLKPSKLLVRAKSWRSEACL